MSEAVKTWHVLEILKVTEEAFLKKGISNSRLNAELLLCHATGDKRIELYLNYDKPLTQIEVSNYREFVKRRLNFEPLQYIIGKTEFYGLTINVNKNILIPRQETELLIDKTLEYINDNKFKLPKILEIGTGSGCIAISIAANAECIINAIDISIEAIELAKVNAANNSLKGEINFLVSDFLKGDISFEEYDIIVSNPPYIPSVEVPNLNTEVHAFEPYFALTDGADGLKFYIKIFELHNNTYKKPQVFLELGDGKKNNIIKILNNFKITDYNLYNDLIKIPRVLELKGSR